MRPFNQSDYSGAWTCPKCGEGWVFSPGWGDVRFCEKCADKEYDQRQESLRFDKAAALREHDEMEAIWRESEEDESAWTDFQSELVVGDESESCPFGMHMEPE